MPITFARSDRLDEETRNIASAMTALSHPRRVALFAILEDAGRTGANLETLLKRSRLTLSTLRHHLSRMEAAGLVTRRRNGVEVRFRIESAPTLGAYAAIVSRLSAASIRNAASAFQGNRSAG